MNQFLQLTVLGVAQAAFLLLAALGFWLTRRVEGFLNIAHAQYLSIAAFVTYYLNERGFHFALAAVIGIGVTVLVGLAVGKIVFERIRPFGPAVSLITSVGVVYLLAGVIEALVGTGSFLVRLPRLDPIGMGPVLITSYQGMVVAVAAAVTVATATFLQYTHLGTAIRITALDRNLGASRGVDVDRASNATWMISAGLAGIAGVVLAVLGALTTVKGFEQILIILAVALLAGIGSITAVAVSALLIGIAREVSLLWLPSGFRDIIAFGIVIVVLILLPHGLSGQTE
jgi:neutral amino acid transport system permease protein